MKLPTQNFMLNITVLACWPVRLAKLASRQFCPRGEDNNSVLAQLARAAL